MTETEADRILEPFSKSESRFDIIFKNSTKMTINENLIIKSSLNVETNYIYINDWNKLFPEMSVKIDVTTYKSIKI